MFEEEIPGFNAIVRAVAYGSAPNHRLTLRYVPVSGRTDWDFFSLDWQQKIGSEWYNYYSISAEYFQFGSSLSRWISDLFSFNPTTSSAIVQIASADSPDLHRYKVVYTWARLHLFSLELQTLQICFDPLEPYLGDAKRIPPSAWLNGLDSIHPIRFSLRNQRFN